MTFLSESYKKRIMELAGLISEKTYYNSHGNAMTFSNFINIEVKERGNYSKKEIKSWIDKYNIKNDDYVIWVTPNKKQALSYMLSADRYYDLMAAESEDEIRKIFQQDLNRDMVEPFSFSENDGIIIPESDDGEDGFLMVLNSQYLNKLNESIEFSRQDLTQVYDKSWQRIQGFDINMIKQAIREGRAIGISYKSTDMPVTKFRVILPVTLGIYKTQNGVPLKLSAYHLAGQSERTAQKTGIRSAEPQYVWRLFDLDSKSFKSMWLSEKFFYEYPPKYKKNDSRFSSIMAQYDTKTAEIERDNREGRGESPGEPIDLTNAQLINPPETSDTKNAPEEKGDETQKNPVEQPLTERERRALYLKKPWNKYLRDGFKFE